MLREISPARIFARPTAEDLWLGPTRESVLSHLKHPGPTRVLLGPASSGRTSMLRHLEYCTADQATRLRASGPQTQPSALLGALLRSTGLEADGLAAAEMHRLISVYIKERLANDKRIIIELDDADMFDRTAWDVVEDLVDLSANGQRPELLMSLVHIDEYSSPAAVHVRRQEAPALSVLSWLEPREVSSYLRWRFARFDLEGINTPAATRLIARCTKGCFASIDYIVQMTLLLLRNRSSGGQINVNVVREATRRLQRQYQCKRGSDPEPAAAIPMTAKAIVSEAAVLR